MTALSTVGVMLASTGRQVLLYKVLSLETLGQYALIVTFVVFIQPVISGNTKMFLISRVPEWSLQRAAALLKTLIIWEIIVNALGMGLLWLLLTAGLPLLHWLPALGSTHLLMWVFPIIMASSIFSHMQRYLCGKLRIATSNAADLGSAILYIALLGALRLKWGMLTLPMVLLCWLLSLTIIGVVLLIILWKDWRTAEPIRLSYIKEAIAYSAPGLAADYGGNVVGYFDRFAVGHYMPASSLGLYGFAYNVMNMAQVASRSVIDSLFGSYYLVATKGKHHQFADNLLRIYIPWACLMSSTVLIFLLCYGRSFILLVSRPAMLAGYPFLLLLWPLLIITLLSQIKSLFISYISDSRMRLVWMNGIIVPASIVVYVLFIRQFHLVGACIASVFTALLTYFIMSGFAPEFKIGRFIKPMIVPFFLTLAVSLAINKALSFLTNLIPSTFLIVGFGGILVCAITVAIGRLTKFVHWRDFRVLSQGLSQVLEQSNAAQSSTLA